MDTGVCEISWSIAQLFEVLPEVFTLSFQLYTTVLGKTLLIIPLGRVC